MKKLAVFLLAVFVITSAAQASYFTTAQSVNVGNTAEWSRTYIVDLYAYTQIYTAQIYGSYTANYSMTYSRWYDICLYNYTAGKWDELIYLLNLNY